MPSTTGTSISTVRAPFASAAFPEVTVSPFALRTEACASPPSAHSGVAATLESSSAVTRIERAVLPATVPAAAETTSGTSGRGGVSLPSAAVNCASVGFALVPLAPGLAAFDVEVAGPSSARRAR